MHNDDNTSNYNLPIRRNQIVRNVSKVIKIIKIIILIVLKKNQTTKKKKEGIQKKIPKNL